MKATIKTTKKSKKHTVKKASSNKTSTVKKVAKLKKAANAVVKMTAKQKTHIKIVRVSDEQGQADKVIVDDATTPVVAAVVDKGVVMMTPVDSSLEQSK